jgi:CDP-diacylglycerol--glycerol-3-phosphate 3-phosphatidyltransferase
VLNIHARTAVGKFLAPFGRALANAGVSPDAITVIGTAATVAAALTLFPHGYWFAGALVVGALACVDLLDGAVARAGGRVTKFGAVLDSTCDRVADSAVFAGIGWYFAVHYQPGMLAAALLCMVLGSLTSYIRARAEGAGMTCNVGIAERADRLVIALLGTGLTGEPVNLPYIKAIGLWALVAASTITVGQRLTTVYQQSKAQQSSAEQSKAQA